MHKFHAQRNHSFWEEAALRGGENEAEEKSQTRGDHEILQGGSKVVFCESLQAICHPPTSEQIGKTKESSQSAQRKKTRQIEIPNIAVRRCQT
jgi:hypothetical protein